MRFLVLAFVVSCACGGRPPMTSHATKAQWDEARAIAVAHVDATYHLPADKVRAENPRIPFLFRAALPRVSAVLVHDGAVVSGGGADKLGGYLDAVDIYAEHALTADDVLDLLYVFAAFPPVDAAAGGADAYVTDLGMPLSMNAAWHGSALDFTLAYRLQAASDPDNDEGDSDDDSTVITVSLWRLHLRKNAAPRWSERRREWDYEHERFVD